MARCFTQTRTVRTLLGAAALFVCLAPLQAQDYTARVIEQTGQVSIRSSGYDTALSPGGIVRPQQVIVTGPNGFAKFQVSDGSIFEVYANSQVKFRVTPANWEHLLEVVLGRVKVFIQHLPGVPNPNQVSSPTAVISVRGTVFDVLVQDDEGTTVVSVDEGLVAVRNMTAGGEAMVKPGQTVTVYRDVPLYAKQVDKSGAYRQVLQAAREAVWQILLGRRNGTVIPGGGSGTTTSTSADKGKPTNGGTTTTTPGSAPGSAPGGPPGSAPGGGG